MRGRRARAAVACAVAGAAVSGLAAPAGADHDPRQGEQWGLATIGAPAAWGAGTGAGIRVAVVDTGVDLSHEDLQAKLGPGRNFVTDGASPQDDNGHGTHVAGIAAAATANHLGIAGTAPGVVIMPVKVLNRNGDGYAEDISDGIRWAVDNGAHVVNLSLSPDAVIGTLFGCGISQAINYAWSRGAVVAIAAGNDFVFSSSCGDTKAVVVTATNRSDQRPGYANGVGGAAWGMAAPGDAILSTMPGNRYDLLSGTSMAVPHVAGAAAILRGLGLSPQATIERLLSTAKDVGPTGRDSTFGSGRLRLDCALDRCTSPPPPTTSTTPATTATSTPPSSPEPQPASSQPAPGGSGGGGSAPRSGAGTGTGGAAPAEPGPAAGTAPATTTEAPASSPSAGPVRRRSVFGARLVAPANSPPTSSAGGAAGVGAAEVPAGAEAALPGGAGTDDRRGSTAEERTTMDVTVGEGRPASASEDSRTVGLLAGAGLALVAAGSATTYWRRRRRGPVPLAPLPPR